MTMKKSRNRKALSKLLLALSLTPVIQTTMFSPSVAAATQPKLSGDTVKSATTAPASKIDAVAILEGSFDLRENGKEKAAEDDWNTHVKSLAAQFNNTAQFRSDARMVRIAERSAESDVLRAFASVRYAFVAGAKQKVGDVGAKFIALFKNDFNSYAKARNCGEEVVVDNDTKNNTLTDGALYMPVIMLKDDKLTLTFSECRFSPSAIAAALSLDDLQKGTLTEAMFKRIDLDTSTGEEIKDGKPGATSLIGVGDIARNTLRLGQKPTKGEWIKEPPKESYNAMWSLDGPKGNDPNAPAITYTAGKISLEDALDGKEEPDKAKFHLEKLIEATDALAKLYDRVATKQGMNDKIVAWCKRVSGEMKLARLVAIVLKSQNPADLDTPIKADALSNFFVGYLDRKFADVTANWLEERTVAVIKGEIGKDKGLSAVDEKGWTDLKIYEAMSGISKLSESDILEVGKKNLGDVITSAVQLDRELKKANSTMNEKDKDKQSALELFAKQSDEARKRAIKETEDKVKAEYESQKDDLVKAAKKSATDALADQISPFGSKTKTYGATAGALGVGALIGIGAGKFIFGFY
jgi:hypothetical protein